MLHGGRLGRRVLSRPTTTSFPFTLALLVSSPSKHSNTYSTPSMPRWHSQLPPKPIHSSTLTTSCPPLSSFFAHISYYYREHNSKAPRPPPQPSSSVILDPLGPLTCLVSFKTQNPLLLLPLPNPFKRLYPLSPLSSPSTHYARTFLLDLRPPSHIMMTHSLVCQLPSDEERRSEETMIVNCSLNLNIYSSLSKTDQIISRYRPIAPKPQPSTHHHSTLDTTSTPLPQKPQRPRPFLRNLSPHLHTRPSRGCRKRSKAGFSPCNSKRSRTPLFDFSSSSPHDASSLSSPLTGNATGNALISSMRQGFTRVLPRVTVSRAGFHGVLEKPASASANLVTLPLLPHPSSAASPGLLTTSLPAANYYSQFDDMEISDLNSLTTATEFPIEDHHHLLQKLKAPVLCCNKVIAPQPVRPIGSSISVGWISEGHGSTSCAMAMRAPKRPEEVEEEVESEVLPAVVSDSNNRVRLANSAYKEMVGQPECSWLDATYDAGVSGGACKRISGKVMLHLSDAAVPPASNAFSCKVRIEWGSDENKSSIYAPCDVIRLSCVSKDYLFSWRFHTREVSEADSHA